MSKVSTYLDLPRPTTSTSSRDPLCLRYPDLSPSINLVESRSYILTYGVGRYPF
ncbi:hypothetical protein M378DRAFT_154805 [Amanita muscaria Koide BX008]|uniref:Uncharacterized protein n=1 Tax=Amanita muscaria (strain Koide BX008) TaxID=946122 RepID=A0A0C2XA58_AMAMK|nr:hypothetical protein M378DRAFT_154805 [Amanita muscaria Koide BX008]